MKRLTERTKEGIAYLRKVRDDEQEIQGHYRTLDCVLESWERLAQYEDLAEQERMHIAPYPNGTKIYVPYAPPEDGITLYKVKEEFYIHGFTECYIGKRGKDWFLTKQGAKNALEKRDKHGK